MNHSKGSKRNSTKKSRPRHQVSIVSPVQNGEKIGPKLAKQMDFSPDDDELDGNDDDVEDDTTYPNYDKCRTDPLFSNEWDVVTLVKLMKGTAKSTPDNSAYTWLRDFVDSKYKKTDPILSLLKWDDPSLIPHNPKATWAEIVTGIYDHFRLETLQDFRDFVDSYPITGTNDSSISEMGKGLHLSVCRLILTISETPPLDAFPLPAFSDSAEPQEFWDLTLSMKNPKLQPHLLSQSWIIISQHFNHPWRAYSTSLRQTIAVRNSTFPIEYGENPRDLPRASKKNESPRASQTSGEEKDIDEPPDEEEDDDESVDSPTSSTDEEDKKSSAMVLGTPTKNFRKTKVTSFFKGKLAPKKRSMLQDPTAETPSPAKRPTPSPTSASTSSKNMEIDANDELESSESDEDDEEDFDEDLRREDDDEEIGGDPNLDSVMADTEDAEYNTGVDRRKDDSTPSTSRPRVKHSSFKAAAMMPVPAAEKVRRLKQFTLQGLPVSKGKVYEVAFPFYYPGGERFLEFMTKQIVTMLTPVFEVDPKLMILSLKESTTTTNGYRDRSTWIRSSKTLKKKITKYSELAPYIDPSGPSIQFAANSKGGAEPGDKVVRTRMRFGYNVDDAFMVEQMRSILNTTDKGYFGPTMIQAPRMARIGWLGYVPFEADGDDLARHIMRRCQYDFEVGLGWTWVNQARNDKKKVDGLKAYHVYVPMSNAVRAARTLSNWFTPSTPKNDCINGSMMRFVPDRFAMNNDQLGLPAYGSILTEMNKMRSQHKKCLEESTVTLVLNDVFDMYKVVDTTPFGKISLLRLLYSIYAIPEPPKTCDLTELPTPDDSSSDSSDVDAKQRPETIGDDDSDATVEIIPPSYPGGSNQKKSNPWKKSLSKRFKKKLAKKKNPYDTPSKPSTSPNDDSKAAKPAGTKNDSSEDSAVELDPDHYDPKPVFQSIFRGRLENEWVILVRKQVKGLGEQIVQFLVPFLTHALVSKGQLAPNNKVLKYWFTNDALVLSKRQKRIWNPEELRGQIGHSAEKTYDWDFLELGMEDPTDNFRGGVIVDPNKKQVCDIDDGDTVAGAMEDHNALLRSREALLQAQEDIESKDNLLATQAAQLAQQQAEMKRIQQELAAMKTNDSTSPAGGKSAGGAT